MTDSNRKLHSTHLFCRIQKATESLRTFQPSADPCFDEFVLDTSREETLLKEMCFGGGTSLFFWFFQITVLNKEFQRLLVLCELKHFETLRCGGRETSEFSLILILLKTPLRDCFWFGSDCGKKFAISKYFDEYLLHSENGDSWVWNEVAAFKKRRAVKC